MKIYCSASTSEMATPFDKYIGTGLWVKCVLSYNEKYVFYARFLDKKVIKDVEDVTDDEDGTSILMCLNEVRLPIPSEMYRRMITEVKERFASAIKFAQPLEVHTNKELFGSDDITVDSTNELDKFVGKDLWVRVDAIVLNYTDSRYVKLYSKSGFEYKYKEIPAEYVENTSYLSDSDFESFVYYIQTDELSTTHIDRLCPIHPIEVLSTDELIAALESSIDQNFYGDEYDDEYYE